MTRRLTLIIAAATACALAGCSPDGQETPTPEPMVLTPTPTPSPEWSAEEQSAIDAVQEYLTVWTDIGQNLDTADWNAIDNVAGDPAANDAFDTWVLWGQNDWRLVGSPTFEVDRVAEGATDSQGTRYHVDGCYITTDTHLADPDGNPIAKQGADRATGNYLVLHELNPHDQYYVIEDNLEGDPC